MTDLTKYQIEHARKELKLLGGGRRFLFAEHHSSPIDTLCDLALTGLDAKSKKSTDYRALCLSMGACPTCIDRAPEPYGCPDCLNTGWMGGDPYERISLLENQLKGVGEPERLQVIEVSGDDWHGLYVNNKLFTEGHSIGVRDIIRAISGRQFIYEDRRVMQTWMEDQGTLPEKLSDIPLSVLEPAS